jgi:hypothetical protein
MGANAAGNWSVTMNTQMGAQQGTLTLKQDGDSLSGTMAGPQGSQDFEGGTVDGDSVAFSINMTQPMAIKLDFTGKIAGDEISGDIDLGAFGKATFTGSRA